MVDLVLEEQMVALEVLVVFQVELVLVEVALQVQHLDLEIYLPAL